MPTPAVSLHLQAVLAKASTTVVVCGLGLPMRTERLGLRGCFLRTERHVSTNVAFDLHLNLYQGTRPLSMLARASYLEKTNQGYGLWIEAAQLDKEEHEKWSQFLAATPIVAANITPAFAMLPIGVYSDAITVMMLGQALTDEGLSALAAEGVRVESVPTIEAALDRAARGDISMAIATLSDSDPSGAELCLRLRRKLPAIRTVLLTSRDSAADFERGLAHGAVSVISQRSTPALVAERIAELGREVPCADAVSMLPMPASLPALPPVPVSAPRATLDHRSFLRQLSSWAMSGLAALF